MSRQASASEQTALEGPESGFAALRRSPEFGGAGEPLDDPGHANDHVAVIYETDEERFAAVVPFIRQGLERGERCVYVVDDPAEEARVTEALRAGGVAVDDALASGALAFYTVEETYLRTEPFDPETMLDFYADVIDESLEAYEGLRVTAGTDWIEDVPFEPFMEYEGRVNALFEETDAMALCHYDRRELPPEVIRDVIRTHPHLIYDGTVCHNFYYTPPEELFGPDEPENEVERMLGTVRDRARAKTEVAEHKRFLRELNEVTADPERSFEEKLQALFDLGCAWFDLDLGGLNTVDPETDRFRVEYLSDDHDHFEPGTELPLSETYCQAAAGIKDAAAVTEPAAEGFDDITVYEEFGAQAYLGTYIPMEGGEDRTFGFLAEEQRVEPFSAEDVTYLELMAQWVKYELERRRREADLRQSKEHFERIFESSNDAIFLLDPATEALVDVNEAACDTLGYSREELLSLEAADLHPDEMAAFRTFVDEVLAEGSGWTDELTCRTKDGGSIPAAISASTIETDDGRLILAAVRGYRERQRRERAMRRLYEIAADPDPPFEEKLDRVFDLGCELFDLELGGMATVDVDADRFEVEVTSGEHDHLRPGEVYPLSETYCREVADDGEIAAIVDPDCEAFEGKLCYDRFGVRTYIGTYLELDGHDDRTFFFLSNEPREEPFSEAERTFHHLMGQWVAFELERERHERELEETIDRLQQSNDRLKQFAYAASHDLQEPLRMVSSYLQLLENRYAADLDDEAREFIDFAVDGADRMRAMVDDLLAYSRVEQSDGSFEPVETDAVLDRVLDDLQVQIEESDATVEVDSLPTVVADGDQLEQLFRNLVSNAIKYSDEPPRVEITAEGRPDRWEVAVADDGIGIDPDRTDRIFEVFKRLHGDEYAGTGIGLALCQEIAENHGGEIRVDSEPGEGSTFYVALPRRSR